ncbi:mdtH [Symbiodinium sp. KB8]|nr:mdtH [Symbiodinium sp. KB8]
MQSPSHGNAVPQHGYKSMKVTLVYPPVRLEPTTIPPGSPVFGAVTPQQTPRFVSGAGSVPVPRTALTPVPGTRQVSQPVQAATTPAPPCVVTVGRLTPRTPPVTLPAKLVSVSRSPVPQVLRSERQPEAVESPRVPSPRVVRTRVTLDSPRVPSPRVVRTKVILDSPRPSSPRVITRAVTPSTARTSALEERLKELEKRLDAKETECKLLEQHLIEVRGCLEEQRERGARDLEQRDLHIQELSRRNNDLISAAQGCLEVVDGPSAVDEEGAPKAPPSPEAASDGAGPGSSASRQRGRLRPEAERDMPTLAALRQRLYPKRSRAPQAPQAQAPQESAVDGPSEQKLERTARPTPRPSTGRSALRREREEREEPGEKSEKLRGRLFQVEIQLQVQLMEASLYSLVPAGEGAEVLFNVPAPEEIPWPNKIAAPPSAPSSDDDFQQDLDVWLGPSSTLPGKLSGREARLKMSLESIRSCASHHSSRHCLQLSDYLRLKLGPVREKEAAIRPQLSFGSALHVGDGVNALCRVCSFHKPPLRQCSKGALCDYCHLHDGRRNRRRRSLREPGYARSQSQGFRGIGLRHLSQHPGGSVQCQPAGSEAARSLFSIANPSCPNEAPCTYLLDPWCLQAKLERENSTCFRDFTVSGIMNVKPGVAAVLLTQAIGAIGNMAVLPVLPFFAVQQLGASALEVALLASCFNFTQMVFAPCVGAISDHFGRKYVMLGGLLLQALSNSFQAEADSPAALLLARGFVGLATSTGPVEMAYIMDYTRDEQQLSYILALQRVVCNGGALLGPVLAHSFQGYGFPAFCRGFACINLLCLFLGSLLWENYSQSLPDEACGSTPLSVQRSRSDLSKSGQGRIPGEHYLAVLFHGGVCYLLGASFGFSFALGVSEGPEPLFLKERYFFGQTEFGWFFMVSNASTLMWSPVIPMFISYVGARIACACGCLGSASALLFLIALKGCKWVPYIYVAATVGLFSTMVGLGFMGSGSSIPERLYPLYLVRRLASWHT